MGLLAVVAAAVAAAGGGPADEPTDTASGPTTGRPESISDNEAHPPQEDLHDDLECTTDEPRLVVAKGTLTNRSSRTSSYMIHVSFNDAAGTRFAEASAFHNDVRAGESVLWDAFAPAMPPGEGWTCEIVSVERFASQ